MIKSGRVRVHTDVTDLFVEVTEIKFTESVCRISNADGSYIWYPIHTVKRVEWESNNDSL